MNHREHGKGDALLQGKLAMKVPGDFEDCAARLKALADPDRLRIVQSLFDGPCSVSEIAGKLGEEIVNVSHHLAVLRRANILRSQKEGRYVRYSIHPDVQIEPLQASAARQINLGCCQVDLSGRKT